MLFLLLGALIGALLAAAYLLDRWKAEEVRLMTAHADANLTRLERVSGGAGTLRELLRREAQASLSLLGVRDDLSFHQCVARRRVFDRALALPGIASGDDQPARQAVSILDRHRAGGFVCEKS